MKGSSGKSGKKVVPALAVVALAAVGCTAAPAEPAPAATVTVTTVTTVTATPTAMDSQSSQEPTPSPASLLKPGDTVKFSSVSLTVTGKVVESDFDQDAIKAWEVKACNLGDEATGVGSSRWIAVTADGGRLNASVISGDSKLEPAYPPGYEDDPRSALAPGECLTGLMPFVDKGIVELRYENAYGDQAAWSVG